MVATLRRGTHGRPQYREDDEEFTVELHHGGFFVGQGCNRAYVDGKVHYFDYCEVDTWSLVWIDDFLYQLHYPKNPALKVYWLLPSKDMSDGLRIISSDTDIIVMQSMIHEVKNFVLYMDHEDNISGLNWEDIVANPVASLPKVISPVKISAAGGKVNDILPDFYSDLKRASNEMEPDDGGADSDSEDDPDFVDSDYEVDVDDDDLFCDNVDEEVPDERMSSVMKFSKGKNKADSEEDVSTDEAHGLDLPDSEGEGEVRMRFESFRDCDLSNPRFKVGMVFDSVTLLKRAVTEHSVKERVDIRFPRNEKKRLHAVMEHFDL